MKQRIKVAITGAGGQIGYALLFRIAAGEMFGKETELDFQLLELPEALPSLLGVVMELEDCAFPLLKSVKILVFYFIILQHNQIIQLIYESKLRFQSG